MVTDLVACIQGDPTLGSVTALSNNVSMYSLPNTDPDRHLADQDIVNWISSGLSGVFAHNVLDIPAGISFCIIIPTPVLRDIGLMDPVFGRGYCEETDFTLRSRRAGYRIGLAPGVFVYHQGGGSNVDAGLLSHGMTTVPANEAIIDMRYPQFRSQVAAFGSSGLLEKMHRDGIRKIVKEAGRQFGYRVDIGWVARGAADPRQVSCQVIPDARPEVLITLLGFEYRFDLVEGDDVEAILRDFFGRDPDTVSIDNLGGRAVPVERLRGGRRSAGLPGPGVTWSVTEAAFRTGKWDDDVCTTIRQVRSFGARTGDGHRGGAAALLRPGHHPGGVRCRADLAGIGGRRHAALPEGQQDLGARGGRAAADAGQAR